MVQFVFLVIGDRYIICWFLVRCFFFAGGGG